MEKSINDFIKIKTQFKVSDNVDDLYKKHYRFYMTLYEYNGDYYVEKRGNEKAFDKEYYVDILACGGIKSLTQIFREDRLKKLLGEDE